MSNRFIHLSQDYIKEDYIKDNKDLLTLPEGAGEEPEVKVEAPVQTNEDGFPNIDFNFFQVKVDPDKFNDDVTALIEHLAELQVPIAVLDKAKELIYQNQQPQTEDPADQEMDQEDAVSNDMEQNTEEPAQDSNVENTQPDPLAQK